MAGNPGSLTCELTRLVPDCSGAGVGRENLREGGELDIAKAGYSQALSAPREGWSPAPGGRGCNPTPEVSMGSKRGASLAHPHPQSDTLGARRKRGRRRAPNNKEQSGKQEPLPRKVGGRGPGPSGPLPWGLTICSLVCPQGGESKAKLPPPPGQV